MTPLKLEQTLRNMIDGAHVAARFYRLLADSTRDAQAKVFLEWLVAREKAYALATEIMALEMTDRALPPHSDRHVDTARTAPEWRFVNDIGLDQATQVAIDAASHSALVYGALADSSSGPARSILAVFSEQQESHAAQLIGFKSAKRPLLFWDQRRASRASLPQGLRNAIAAEAAAARFHTYLTSRTADRPARVFLERLAVDERANAEALEILVLEHSDRALPETADDQAQALKVPASLQVPTPIGLAAALEQALVSQILGARHCRLLAVAASGALAAALAAFSDSMEEHMTELVVRRNQYSRTRAVDVPSLLPEDFVRLLGPEA